MRKFIVVRDPYCRFGDEEPMTMELMEAEDEDALAIKLAGNGNTWVDLENAGQDEESPFEALERGNGDGADFYLISELLPTGELKKIL